MFDFSPGVGIILLVNDGLAYVSFLLFRWMSTLIMKHLLHLQSIGYYVEAVNRVRCWASGCLTFWSKFKTHDNEH